MKTTIFQCSKNCGSLTRVTRLKVALNMADPISSLKAALQVDIAALDF